MPDQEEEVQEENQSDIDPQQAIAEAQEAAQKSEHAYKSLQGKFNKVAKERQELEAKLSVLEKEKSAYEAQQALAENLDSDTASAVGRLLDEKLGALRNDIENKYKTNTAKETNNFVSTLDALLQNVGGLTKVEAEKGFTEFWNQKPDFSHLTHGEIASAAQENGDIGTALQVYQKFLSSKGKNLAASSNAGIAPTEYPNSTGGVPLSAGAFGGQQAVDASKLPQYQDLVTKYQKKRLTRDQFYKQAKALGVFPGGM